jgi:hypothetical protein
MRIVALAVALLVVVPRIADACGFWSMTDNEKKRSIGYLINSGEITSDKGKRLGMLYLDIDNKPGLRVVRERKVVFDIKHGKLLKLGKAIATIDGNTISFGRRVYTIELTDPHQEHEGIPAWKLAVKRGDQLILEAEHASSLCAGLHREMTAAQLEDEVRRRVIYYLAWREVGA